MMDFVLADVDPATLWRLLVITGCVAQPALVSLTAKSLVFISVLYRAIPATVLLLVLVLCIPESPVS